MGGEEAQAIGAGNEEGVGELRRWFSNGEEGAAATTRREKEIRRSLQCRGGGTFPRWRRPWIVALRRTGRRGIEPLDLEREECHRR